MASAFVETDGDTLKETEDAVAAVLLHLKKLLRIKNRLCSPLLRLPTETIIHILSYVMGEMEYSFVWGPIFSTCHHIHNIMLAATELWRKADFSWDKAAKFVMARSKGCPEAIIIDLDPWDAWRNPYGRKAPAYCRNRQRLGGRRLRTLEFFGEPSDMVHFSWIFERPLPRLHHLKIHISRPLDEEGEELPLRDPVFLQLPTDLPLRVLDLRNATLPWSSNLFTGLSGLHLDFRDCDIIVEVSEDELLGIFDASRQLESLSLVQVEPRIPIRGGELELTPTRIVQLPRLAFLKLDNYPESVGYILAHMDVPAINSLEVHSRDSSQEVEWSLGFFFPEGRFPDRLFSDPPVFKIETEGENGSYDPMNVSIGGVNMWFYSDPLEQETTRDTILTYVTPLVPPSVTILKLDNSKLNEQEWREFFRSHPEVRSIESSQYPPRPMPESLWDALSPTGADAAPLCPKLELISPLNNPVSTALLNCLLNRKTAGFGLRHLKLREVDDELVEELAPLVEVVEYVDTLDPQERKVGFDSIYKLDVLLTESQWGWNWVLHIWDEVDLA